MEKKTVIITGGTGMVGSRLTEMLIDRNYKVIILTRNKEHKKFNHSQVNYSEWDVKSKKIDNSIFEKSDFIIHLAGANVGKGRWTKERKKKIIESRTASSQLIVDTLKSMTHSVEAVVSASAIGYYGAKKDNSVPFVETDKPGNDFLANVCIAWENSIEPVKDLNIRLTILRTGIVISKQGGMLQQYSTPFKFGVVPVLGNGNQLLSPIHIDDLCNMYIFALENNLAGKFNAVSPDIVTNETFAKKAFTILKGKKYLPIKIPSFALKMALGEFSTEILKSAPVSSQKIIEAGFQFSFPTLEEQLTKEK